MSAKPSSPKAADDPRCLMPVDLANLTESVLDPTSYAIGKIFPRGHVTLLGGHGGGGKSIAALTMAAHVAGGAPTFGGLEVFQSPALVASLEDNGALTRFRLRRIVEAYGLDAQAVARNLLLLDGSAANAALATELSDSGVRRLVPTRAMEELEVAAEGRRLVVVDNASDGFDGDENSRRLVRAFIRHLAQIARRNDAALLLLAHLDKFAARNGSAGNSYSGSTAWHNGVRSRLALIEDEIGIKLVQEKSNLAKKIAPIRFEWTAAGVLMPVAVTGTASVDQAAQDDADVLAAIQAANRDGATVHAARSGAHTPLAVLGRYPDLPIHLRKDRARFWAALTRLERSGALIRETYLDNYRHERARLICATECAFHSPHTPQRRDARAERVSASVVRATKKRGKDALNAVDQNGKRRLFRIADEKTSGDWSITTLPGSIEQVRQVLEQQIGQPIEVRDA